MNNFSQNNNDVYQNYGQDLVLSSNNDLESVTSSELSKQRILRRLMTNPGDYIWHPEYGAGLPQFIGVELSNTTYDEIKSRIISQIFLEDTVSKTPTPEIFLQTIQGGLYAQINYTEVNSNNPIVFSFEIN